MGNNPKEEKKAFIALVFSLIRERFLISGYSCDECMPRENKIVFVGKENREVNKLLSDAWCVVKNNDCYKYYFKDEIKIILDSTKGDHRSDIDALIQIKLKRGEEVIIKMRILSLAVPRVEVHIY
jgi:hypothetical protein